MKPIVYLATAGFAALLSTSALAQDAKPDIEKAIAVLQATQGNKVAGSITFTKVDGGIKVEGEVTGLTPGKHGFHVHQFGDVSSTDGSSAGGHFNPGGHKHGAPDADERHAGDFGNIEADAAGKAKVDFVDKKISFEGAASILGRGLVVHAKADDLKTQPTGDAGGRVAVAVIGATGVVKK